MGSEDVKNDKICTICGNAEANSIYVVREMMYGTHEEFEYFRCGDCGCMQIAEIPKNLSKYYPENYYSFVWRADRGRSDIRRRLRECRDAYAVFKRGRTGRLLQTLFPDHELAILAATGVRGDGDILDVGCGSGALVERLGAIAEGRVLGIDAFVREERSFSRGGSIHRKTLAEAEGAWDLIMFNHSFEHLEEPVATLRLCRNRLKRNGAVLIRVPVVDCWAWEHYREDFVQLDAPRHLFIHTTESMARLAKAAGFSVQQVVSESSVFQFVGSEQYKRGIALRASGSYFVDRTKSIFSQRNIRAFRRDAHRLRKANLGDQRAFILRLSSVE